MSDLTASHCGCEGNRPAENNGCGGILWIIILLSCCGGNGSGMGCGNSCGCGGGGGICGGGNSGGGCDNILFLILILSCCGGGSFC